MEETVRDALVVVTGWLPHPALQDAAFAVAIVASDHLFNINERFHHARN